MKWYNPKEHIKEAIKHEEYKGQIDGSFISIVYGLTLFIWLTQLILKKIIIESEVKTNGNN